MTKKKDEAVTSAEAATPVRKGMFARFKAVDEATRAPDIENFKLAEGDNLVRIIRGPVMVRKHWNLPANAGKKVINCLRQIITDEQMEAYAEAAGSKDPKKLEAFWADFPECPFCAMAAQYPGFYTLEVSYAHNVVVEGKPMVWDISQNTIMRELAKFEDTDTNKVWKKFMPNGLLSDMELVVKKEKTGPQPQNVKYTIGGNPESEPLTDDMLKTYLDQSVDLIALRKVPDLSTEDGKAKVAELIALAGKPAEGEKPRPRGAK